MKDLRVLFVENSPFDFERVRLSLERNFHLSEFVQVENESQLHDRLEEKTWDLVLSDYHLRDLTAREALAYVREQDENKPFILVSGAIGEEKTVEILKFGADDVVMKNNLSRLNFAIERVLREHRVRESEIEARQQAEDAIRAREQMLTVVSHDLRNPLGAIQLNAETLKHKIEDARTLDEAQAVLDHVKTIVRSSLRMKNLIADVLDKVRLEGGSFTVNRTRRTLNDFLQEMVELFEPLSAEKKIKFEWAPLAKKVEASMDFERLAQILSNLVGNAIKFTPAGGQILLEARLRGGDIEFRVRDSGPGIDDQDLKRIFEKYWQNQANPRQGVGLGLSIAKALVAAHGGRIWVESCKGQGATFGFYIPCEWRELEPAKDRGAALSSKWICLVDDDDDLREILDENLRELGYEVTAFATGTRAVAELNENPRIPNLMILDYRLPDMNGGQVIELVRPHLAQNKVPVIFLSAEANLRTLAQHHQASAFFTKPLRLRDLARAIEDLL